MPQVLKGSPMHSRRGLRQSCATSRAGEKWLSAKPIAPRHPVTAGEEAILRRAADSGNLSSSDEGYRRTNGIRPSISRAEDHIWRNNYRAHAPQDAPAAIRIWRAEERMRYRCALGACKLEGNERVVSRSKRKQICIWDSSSQ